MKKWLVGSLIAITIMSLSTAVYATSNSMVGKKVQSEVVVKLNDQELSTGVIIDDTTYLPVRTVAEALSVDVGYKPGEVSLLDDNKKKLGRIKSLNSQIKLNEDGIETANQIIVDLSDTPDYFTKEQIEIYEEMIVSAQADILTYEQNIQELSAQRDALIEELQ